MSTKTGTWFKDHVGTFMLTGVLLFGWLYAITTSWQSERKIAAQSEQLGEIRGDLAEIKKSFVSLLLDKDPNRSEIVKRLVSDARTLQGIEKFKAGKFEAAYATWIPSANQGSKDAVFAIAAANAALKQQASDASLPYEQRVKAQVALINAPLIEVQDGVLLVRSNE